MKNPEGETLEVRTSWEGCRCMEDSIALFIFFFVVA